MDVIIIKLYSEYYKYIFYVNLGNHFLKLFVQNEVKTLQWPPFLSLFDELGIGMTSLSRLEHAYLW